MWGAICSNGAAYVFTLKAKITAHSFQRMLEETMLNEDINDLPSKNVILQDNVPIHVASSTVDFFKSCGNHLMEWPLYSPDL